MLLAACLLSLLACEGVNTPLDATTRQRIDSTSAAQIDLARTELTELCSLQRTTLLPVLIDSIRQKRLSEIQQQLKTVPR
ncbi:MAG: hypothetical protein JNK89_09480 [Saprospiraceae bacterium]|nr:hypothetical protein [Saprospiraceae bacterium]